MTPEFAAAGLPLMQHVLDLFSRAERRQTAAAEEERMRLQQAFATAEARLRGPRADEWKLASYALAAVVDELLIVDINWPGQSWWENHAMEVELFGSRARATEFYKRAEQAAALPLSDAIHFYVAAVLMGFRGILREQPDQFEAWLRSNGRFIRNEETRPALPAQAAALAGAPPLYGSLSLLWQSVLMVVLAAILGIAAWWAFWLA